MSITTRVKYFLGPHKKIYFFLIATGIVIGVLEAFNLAIFIPILTGLVGDSPASISSSGLNLVQHIKDFINYFDFSNPFMVAASIFLIITVLKGILAIVFEYVTAKTSGKIMHGYRLKLMKKYASAPLAFFAENRIGGFVYNLMMPPINLGKFSYILPRMCTDFFRFLSVFLVLLYVSPAITLSISALGAMSYFLLSKKMSKLTLSLSNQRRIAEEQMSGLAAEWLNGIKPIRLSGNEPHWLNGFESNSQLATHSYSLTATFLATPRHFFELATFTLLLVGLMLSFKLSPANFSAHVATIGLFSMGIIRILPSIAALSRAPLELKMAMPDVDYLYDCMNEAVQSEKFGDNSFDHLTSGIRFNSVSAEYKERGKVLREVNIFLPRGKVTALVGASGAGKSTILNLLLGAIQPSGGAVFYDDVDLASISRSSLSKLIGYVGQNVLLFKGKFKDNISFFNPDVSIEQIEKACQLAELGEFVGSLPHGLDTEIGEGGLNLSGGQAQRVAIARALVNDPEILIFDEATSSLDSFSEKSVMSALQNVSKGRTVVMVAHRLSSVRWADLIYVVDNGVVAEQGDWAKLTNQTDGLFKRMCEEQHLV